MTMKPSQVIALAYDKFCQGDKEIAGKLAVKFFETIQAETAASIESASEKEVSKDNLKALAESIANSLIKLDSDYIDQLTPRKTGREELSDDDDEIIDDIFEVEESADEGDEPESDGFDDESDDSDGEAETASHNYSEATKSNLSYLD